MASFISHGKYIALPLRSLATTIPFLFRRNALQLMTIAPWCAPFTLREVGRAVHGFPSNLALPVLLPRHRIHRAVEANTRMQELVLGEGQAQLAHFTAQGKACQRSIPDPEHYPPLFDTRGLKDRIEAVLIFHDRTVKGSISMISSLIG